MRMNPIKWLPALFAILPAISAASYCTGPTVPSCIRYGIGFSSKSDFEMCKWDMERYLQKVKEYRQCLQIEIESALQNSENASREANKAVDRFNCYARGERFCP